MQKSRARITYHLQEVEKMEPRKRNVLVAVVVGLLLFACCVTTAGLATKQYWWTAVCPPAEVIEKEVVVEKTVIVEVEKIVTATPEPAKATPTSTPTATPTAAPTKTTVEESVQGCPGWTEGEVRVLKPGQSALGDVKVGLPDWDKLMTAYDVGGEGEGTVIINLSDQNVLIDAPHGAGCLATTDKIWLKDGELDHGCDDAINGCDRVFVVLVTNEGMTIERYPQQ